MFVSLRNRFNQSSEFLQDILTMMGRRLCSLMKIGPESSLRIRRRQFLWGGCLGVSIIAFVYGVMTILLDRGPIGKKQEEAIKPIEINIATAPKHINMGEVRWNNLENS